MDEPRNDSKRPSGNSWVWFLVVPLIYVLSIGPAALVLHATKAGPKAEEVATALYYPIILAAEKSGREDLLEAYIELWIP